MTKAQTETQGGTVSRILPTIITLFITIVPAIGFLIAVWRLLHGQVSKKDIGLTILSFILGGLGVTAGYHRMLIHRSFEAKPLVRIVLVTLGATTWMAGPIGFAANHLKHHANSDREGDPHSPNFGFDTTTLWGTLKGLVHAQWGWLVSFDDADPKTYAQRLAHDKTIVVIDRLFPILSVLALLVPFLLRGWRGLLWEGLVAIFLRHIVTWMINSIDHRFGSQPFATGDKSRNVWILALPSLGESWHNNHHKFPNSAFHGLRWWEFDITGRFIQLLELCHLASNVKGPSAEQIQHGLEEADTQRVIAAAERVVQNHQHSAV